MDHENILNRITILRTRERIFYDLHQTVEGRQNRQTVSLVSMRQLGRRCDKENFPEEIPDIDMLIKDGLLSLQHQSE